MGTIRIDKGEETVQFIRGENRQATLEALRDWLDEQPPEVLEGITINRSLEKGYRLTITPLAVWVNGRIIRHDIFGEARDLFVRAAGLSGDHWV